MKKRRRLALFTFTTTQAYSGGLWVVAARNQKQAETFVAESSMGKLVGFEFSQKVGYTYKKAGIIEDDIYTE